MPTLAGIDLGSDIYIEDEHSISRVQSVMERTLDNTVLIWEQEGGSQAFDLVGSSNSGVLTKAKLDQLRDYANTLNATYTLIYNGVSQTVRFRNWEGEVVSGSPLGPREKIKDEDIYTNIRIKLMEV